MDLSQLPRFNETLFAQAELEIRLRSRNVRAVKFFILGPEGTNIEKASKQWAREVALEDKSDFYFCETPEQAVSKARSINDEGIFPVFTTCAVYNTLNQLFFDNPDCYTFFSHYYMKLDEMQLASRYSFERIPINWTIASHPSPKSLVAALPGHVLEVTSNSMAACMCAEGRVDACITTERSRKRYELEKLHSFGSPTMVFLFGTTAHGVKILGQRKG